MRRLIRCFKTAEGEMVPLRNIINAPRSLVSAVARRYMRRPPIVPFIPYSASKYLNGVINTNTVVVEVGAGYSTVWLARRSAQVHSFEWSRDWFQLISERLTNDGLE